MSLPVGWLAACFGGDGRARGGDKHAADRRRLWSVVREKNMAGLVGTFIKPLELDVYRMGAPMGLKPSNKALQAFPFRLDSHNESGNT